MLQAANCIDEESIFELYKNVIEHVNTTNIKLGWNIDIYPDREFIKSAITNQEMLIEKDGDKIVAAAVVNHTVNPEYDEIDWEIKEPKTKIATIHALALDPKKRGTKVSYKFLSDIEKYCHNKGDLAIHLDVIDTNIPAYKLYLRNGYKEIACIKMYYEVVGTREFWMLEHVI